jgi:uncharacterized membrane protein YgdD (TMEM256/DUF423 family)
LRWRAQWANFDGMEVSPRLPGQRTLIAAGLLLATATALGAFGTHALRPSLPPARFDSFQIGVTYQFFHALGLLGLGLLRQRHPGSAALRAVAWLLLVGIALFCGSIYALTFGAPRWFGMVAPIGGVSLIAAWLLFARAVTRLPRGLSSAP